MWWGSATIYIVIVFFSSFSSFSSHLWCLSLHFCHISHVHSNNMNNIFSCISNNYLFVWYLIFHISIGLIGINSEVGIYDWTLILSSTHTCSPGKGFFNFTGLSQCAKWPIIIISTGLSVSALFGSYSDKQNINKHKHLHKYTHKSLCVRGQLIQSQNNGKKYFKISGI